MHIFSLGENESVVIGDDMVVRVVAIQNDTVQIEIQYPDGFLGEEEGEEYQAVNPGLQNGRRTGARNDHQVTGNLRIHLTL